MKFEQNFKMTSPAEFTILHWTYENIFPKGIEG